jgi:hypothetical protein
LYVKLSLLGLIYKFSWSKINEYGYISTVYIFKNKENMAEKFECDYIGWLIWILIAGIFAEWLLWKPEIISAVLS